MRREDLKWLYAAYRLGGFEGKIEEGLGPDEFNQLAIEKAQTVHQLFALFAPGHKEGQLVGIVSAVMDENANVEIHAEWLPWATPRNIIEASLQFIRDMGRDMNLVVYSRMKTKEFFERLCNYGVLEKVGHLKRFFGADKPVGQKERAVLFQSREM